VPLEGLENVSACSKIFGTPIASNRVPGQQAATAAGPRDGFASIGTLLRAGRHQDGRPGTAAHELMLSTKRRDTDEQTPQRTAKAFILAALLVIGFILTAVWICVVALAGWRILGWMF
jgi:hypothetical protein